MKTTKDRKKSDRSYSKKRIKNPFFLRFFFRSIVSNKEKSQKKGKTACLITRGIQRRSGKHRQAKSISPYNFLKKLYQRFHTYQQALKLMSRPFTECVRAPTEMKSTPHSA